MSIVYLPLLIVRQNFRMFVTSNDSRNIIRQHPTLRSVVDYLAKNYFVGQFDPNLWNVFNRDNQCSTNNIVESFHSHLDNKIGQRHPSLWLFITKLKDQQRQNMAKVTAANRGQLPPPQKAKWRNLNRRISRIKASYNAGKHTLNRYWDAIKHCIHHFVER